MPQSAWVILAVLPLALLVRVIFFAAGSHSSGGRGRKHTRSDDGIPAPVGGAIPLDGQDVPRPHAPLTPQQDEPRR